MLEVVHIPPQITLFYLTSRHIGECILEYIVPRKQTEVLIDEAAWKLLDQV